MGSKKLGCKFFIAIALFAYASTAHAEGPGLECQLALSEITSDSTDLVKRVITLLQKKSFINKQVLSEIAHSEKYFDFLESAHFRRLFDNEITYLAFQTVFKKIDKNDLKWEEIKKFSKGLLNEQSQKEVVVKAAKEETKSILVGKTESRVDIEAINQPSLFKHQERWMGIVSTGNSVQIYDFKTGKIEAEIAHKAFADDKIQIIEGNGKITAAYYSEKSGGLIFSDISDLKNIKTTKVSQSFGQYLLVPFSAKNENYVLVYDTAHRDIQTVNIYNLTKMQKKPNPDVLPWSRPSTKFQILNHGDNVFYGLGNSEGAVVFSNALIKSPLKKFNTGEKEVFDFKLTKIEGRQAFVSLTQNSEIVLMDFETQKEIAKGSLSDNVAFSNNSRIYIFKHEGKDFVALFGFSNVDIYELPSLAFFKSYSVSKTIVPNFRGAGHEELFSHEGKTYFVILLRDKVVAINSLTEEVIFQLPLPDAAHIDVVKTERGVLGAITTKTGEVVNVTLVGSP